MTGGNGVARVRHRQPDDVAVVVEFLLRQQPLTRYPLRNPLPFPPEQFVVREREIAAWVAEFPGGPVVGHVAVLNVGNDHAGRLWSQGADRPIEELAALSVLVVDQQATGRGLGRLLIDTAVAHIVSLGRTPVLEVLNAHSRAATLYRALGWEAVAKDRPAWLPEDEEPIDLMILRAFG